MLDLLSQADQQRFKSMVDVGLTRTGASLHRPSVARCGALTQCTALAELPDHVQPRDDLTVEQLADLEPLAQVRLLALLPHLLPLAN